jgi:hypothetical protein
MSPSYTSAPATHATLAEAISCLCREANGLVAAEDYSGALACFGRAAALLNEQEKLVAADAKSLT